MNPIFQESPAEIGVDLRAFVSRRNSMVGGYTFLNEAVWGKKEALLRIGPGVCDQLKVRFDGEADEAGQQAFRIVFTAGDPPAIDPLIQGQVPLEIAFNTPGARIFFDALPVRRGRGWFRHWATLRWPDKLTVVERRGGPREQIPDDVDIIAVLSLPEGGPTLRARLWDLDLKGMACICSSHPELPAPSLDQPIDILLTHGGQEYRLKGFCRNLQPLSTNSLRVGLQFESEAELEPETLVRFKYLIDELHGLGVRRSFRKNLKNTVTYTDE